MLSNENRLTVPACWNLISQQSWLTARTQLRRRRSLRTILGVRVATLLGTVHRITIITRASTLRSAHFKVLGFTRLVLQHRSYLIASTYHTIDFRPSRIFLQFFCREKFLGRVLQHYVRGVFRDFFSVDMGGMILNLEAADSWRGRRRLRHIGTHTTPSKSDRASP